MNRRGKGQDVEVACGARIGLAVGLDGIVTASAWIDEVLAYHDELLLAFPQPDGLQVLVLSATSAWRRCKERGSGLDPGLAA